MKSEERQLEEWANGLIIFEDQEYSPEEFVSFLRSNFTITLADDGSMEEYDLAVHTLDERIYVYAADWDARKEITKKLRYVIKDPQLGLPFENAEDMVRHWCPDLKMDVYRHGGQTMFFTPLHVQPVNRPRN